jgi:cytochrome c-type biogenesis protein CcmH
MGSIFAELSNIASSDPAWIAATLLAAMAAVASAIVAWPVFRGREKTAPARALLAAALGMFVIGVGGGAYLLLGTPELAVRALAAPEARGLPGWIAELSRLMPKRPNDLTGWTLLGRGYLTLNDPSQAAIAFRHAARLAPPDKRPELFSSYGEALALAAGTVTPEAEAAFEQALAGNPKDFAARFYLGQVYAERREVAKARALWSSLLADSPPNAPWRADLIDRMAALQMQGGAAPNVEAMVESLAARLRAQPDDLAGWERLVRAYAVLGKDVEAKAAVSRARAEFAQNPEKLAAIETEAHSLSLEK